MSVCTWHGIKDDRSCCIGNSPDRVSWWDYTWEAPDLSPIPSTIQRCGCYIRNTDYEAVLCPEHLAALNQPRR